MLKLKRERIERNCKKIMQTEMNYIEALDYISSRLRFGIKPGLERTIELLDKLGNPQNGLSFIHVAGTNGKGSVCAMVSAVLSAEYGNVGLYTSPYISDFRERMQIDGHMIEKEELADVISRVRPYADKIEELTEFELITCAAMLWFCEKKCSFVVLETGLGGRFDATNVIKSPVCSVITKIGLDHTAILGDTFEKIAFEKAGIIKEGCPVVSAVQRSEAGSVIEKTAAARNSAYIRAGICRPIRADISGTDAEYDGIRFRIPFAGAHQLENAAAAVEALRAAGGSDDAISNGISKATIPARLEYFDCAPSILIDGAHNPDGAHTLADALCSLIPEKRKIAVMGILADKNYSEMLDILLPCFDTVVTAQGYNPRELSSKELAEEISNRCKAVEGGSPEEAFAKALEISSPDDIIVVCGSLYLAGAVRPKCLSYINKEVQ